jgi:hypothetical protein
VCDTGSSQGVGSARRRTPCRLTVHVLTMKKGQPLGPHSLACRVHSPGPPTSSSPTPGARQQESPAGKPHGGSTSTLHCIVLHCISARRDAAMTCQGDSGECQPHPYPSRQPPALSSQPSAPSPQPPPHTYTHTPTQQPQSTLSPSDQKTCTRGYVHTQPPSIPYHRAHDQMPRGNNCNMVLAQRALRQTTQLPSQTSSGCYAQWEQRIRGKVSSPRN